MSGAPDSMEQYHEKAARVAAAIAGRLTHAGTDVVKGRRDPWEFDRALVHERDALIDLIQAGRQWRVAQESDVSA